MATRKRIQLPDDALFAEARKKSVPFEFVLDELASLGPYTKPMFGCTAVYVEEQIVFILRERPSHPEDNGVWVATTREHHDALRAELPSLRSIGVLAGGGETGWQMIPADSRTFEDEVMRACALVQRRDPRIGKIPKAKRPAGPRTKAKPKPKAKVSSRTAGARKR